MDKSLNGIYSSDNHVASFGTVRLDDQIMLFFQNMNQNENEKDFNSWLDEVFDNKVKSYAKRDTNSNSKPTYTTLITPAEFEYFKEHVLNKEITKWNICVKSTTVNGTWRTNDYMADIVESYQGGSSRKSKRIHRKPTKRRRNRRGNRKTKKN